MFEDSLLESAALLRSRNRWPALLSITAECAVAVFIVSLPLLHPELIRLPSRISVSLASPHFPPPQPVQLPRMRTVYGAAYASSPSMPAEPTVGSQSLPLSRRVDAPTLGPVNLASNDTALLLGAGSLAPGAPRVTVRATGPEAAGTKQTGPARISSGVIAGLLIAPIRPEYPDIAKITHTQGTVVVDAIISRAGAIESAQVLSGPPMLRAAALEAVRQARYRPFLLNGQPTEVQTTVTIVFRMGS